MRFCVNVSILFKEVPLLERFEHDGTCFHPARLI